MKTENMKKLIVCVLLAALAVLSIFPMGRFFSKPETYAATIASIDDKVETVLKLTATSTVASAAISAIPDDTATPIAEKLADFTEYFLLILCTLYAEKYLLTIIGCGIFQILIPLACAAGIYSVLREQKTITLLARKMALLGLAIFIAIPMSIRVSDMIFDTYRESIEETISAAEEFSTDAADLSETSEDEGFFSSIVTKITTTASNISNRAAAVVNHFIESLAVMIVTSCIIPIVVLAFFLWLVKLVTGVDISVRSRRHSKAMALVD